MLAGTLDRDDVFHAVPCQNKMIFLL